MNDKVRVRVWNYPCPDVPGAGAFLPAGSVPADIDVKAEEYVVREGVLEIIRATPTGFMGDVQRRALGLPLHSIALYLAEQLP